MKLNGACYSALLLIATINVLAQANSPHDTHELDQSQATSGSSGHEPASVVSVHEHHHPLGTTTNPLVGGGGECVNSSAEDGKCRLGAKESQKTRYGYEMAEENNSPLTAAAHHLDDQSLLDERLKNIDKLDQKLFVDTINDNLNNQNDWHNQEPAPTLRQVLMLHRHADRTPIEFAEKDPLKSEPFWTFHGLGQLTNRGKARLHLLGQMYRKRYNGFMGKSVNKNQRISRASGSLRCIESAQVFLSSFLGLNSPNTTDASELTWDARNNSLGQMWQPASVQSVPAKMDGMLAESAACKALEAEYLNVIDKSDEVKDIQTKYAYESEQLDKLLGFKTDHFYKWFWASGQLEVEQSYFPDKMKPELMAIYGRLEEAGVRAMTAYQSTLRSRRLRCGLLIQDMLDHMKRFRDASSGGGDQPIAGALSPKKFVHYAAHDLTLVIMLSMLDSWPKFQARPDYASNIALELHQDGAEWFVRLFYMPRVPSASQELHLSRCEDNHPLKRCSLDQFERLMSQYTIANWQAWQRECGNDLSQLDAYLPGQ